MTPPHTSADCLVAARRIVTPGGVRDGVVVVRGGRIEGVVPREAAPAGTIRDFGDAWLLPGLVDPHVHINEPGRTEWEGFETATRAAVAGGVTTLVDMPLNSTPATTTVAALRRKREAAAGSCHVDVAFWGGVVPGNTGELAGLAAAGVAGFKCFLVPSGVDDFGHVGERDLREAMPVLAGLGLPLLAHAESPGALARAVASAAPGDPRSYERYLRSRPPESEVEAIRLLLRLCLETGCRVHIVHLSAAEALAPLREARGRGLPVTVETCPHYLHFCAEHIPDGATQYKCAPPIRGRANRDLLMDALLAGDIDLVGTDHSPCPPGLKLPGEGDFLRAWGGIASLQVGLAATWTRARRRGATPAHLAGWMSGAPAALAGLSARKGRIEVGYDADFVAWHPEESFEVHTSLLFHRHPVCPYSGEVLDGRVEATYLRGQCIFERGQVEAAHHGELLERPRGGAR